MRDFEVSTDSTCDLYVDEIKDLDISVGHLEFTLSSGDDITIGYDDFKKREEYIDFYNKMRKGIIAKTAILSVQAHVDLFTDMAKRGIKRAIHISQGYGLSPTVDNANQAIEIVKKDFPDIEYTAIECNTTTIGEGFIVKACCKMRDEGKSKEETLKVLDEIKQFTQHFVLVNDLKFLARGGRISRASASIGSLLQVKPIIEFGRDGKLKVCRKEIGLKKAMKSIVNDYKKFTLNKDFPYIAIVHTDNEPLAFQLQSMLKQAYGIEAEIRIMGPTIGAHIGPGAVAYGFISNEVRPYE